MGSSKIPLIQLNCFLTESLHPASISVFFSCFFLRPIFTSTSKLHILAIIARIIFRIIEKKNHWKLFPYVVPFFFPFPKNIVRMPLFLNLRKILAYYPTFIFFLFSFLLPFFFLYRTSLLNTCSSESDSDSFKQDSDSLSCKILLPLLSFFFIF